MKKSLSEKMGEVMIENARIYAEINQQQKELKKKADPLNKEIKEYMRTNKQTKLDIEDYQLIFSVQERSSMNEDALVEKLKRLGLHEAIQTVEKPNEVVIEELIYEGKLSAIELQSCIDIKFIEKLEVKKK